MDSSESATSKGISMRTVKISSLNLLFVTWFKFLSTWNSLVAL